MRKRITSTAYKEFFRIISSIHSLGDVTELLTLILRSGMKLTGGEASSIMLASEKGDFLEFHSALGGGSKGILEKIRVPKKSIAGHVYKTGKPLLVDDVEKDSRFFSKVDSQTQFRTRSILCVPLIINRKIIGVMQLLNSRSGRVFTEEDLDIFTAFASQAAISITNSKLYEEIVTEKERTSLVFNNLPVGLILVQPDGEIISCNRFIKKLTGKSALIGKNIFRHKTGFLLELANIIKSGETGDHNLHVKIKDEVLDFRVMICRMDSVHWQGTALIIEDLTQLLKAREVAAWQEVARKLAHELKNPLTPIQLAAQYLEYIYQKGDKGFEQELQKHINIINGQVEKLKKMLTEFSSFARLPLPKFQEGSISKTLINIRNLYEKSYPDVEFELKEGKIPRFYFDPSQIEQVLINLVKNAIEAMDENNVASRKVRLEATHSKGTLQLKVENMGPPIPENIRSELFKPYVSTKATGTGLGLAIVQRIINEHGGSITVRNMDWGVSFRIEMPLKEQP